MYSGPEGVGGAGQRPDFDPHSESGRVGANWQAASQQAQPASDLDAEIASVRQQLQNPGLTSEQRMELSKQLLMLINKNKGK